MALLYAQYGARCVHLLQLNAADSDICQAANFLARLLPLDLLYHPGSSSRRAARQNYKRSWIPHVMRHAYTPMVATLIPLIMLLAILPRRGYVQGWT